MGTQVETKKNVSRINSPVNLNLDIPSRNHGTGLAALMLLLL